MESKLVTNGTHDDDFDYESTPGTPNEQGSSSPAPINGKLFCITSSH